MYGTDLSDEENAENMYQMFVNLPAEVITQGVSMIHGEFSKFFRAEYFNGESNKQGESLALLGGFNNGLLIFKIIMFGLLVNYQEW